MLNNIKETKIVNRITENNYIESLNSSRCSSPITTPKLETSALSKENIAETVFNIKFKVDEQEDLKFMTFKEETINTKPESKMAPESSNQNTSLNNNNFRDSNSNNSNSNKNKSRDNKTSRVESKSSRAKTS